MKLRTTTISIIFMIFGISGTVFAQDPVETVVDGCTPEIEAYCSQVSPGEGRMLACFYAHEDKLSGKCQYALYEASVQLEQAVTALNYLASSCQNDIVTFCAQVEAGEGRIVECLTGQGDELSEACAAAIDEVVEVE